MKLFISQPMKDKTNEEIKAERELIIAKAKERYGIGILNNGRAITVARNIAVATSYPAQPIINVRSTESGTGYPQGPTN